MFLREWGKRVSQPYKYIFKTQVKSAKKHIGKQKLKVKGWRIILHCYTKGLSYGGNE
jgi:hypothetical protein